MEDLNRHLTLPQRSEYSLNENMRQCIDVILTWIFSVIDIKAGMPQTILRKHNIQRAQYLYNDSIGIELQVLERNNASRKRDIVKNAVTNFAIGCLVNKLRMRIFTWLVEAGRRNATAWHCFISHVIRRGFSFFLKSLQFFIGNITKSQYQKCTC